MSGIATREHIADDGKSINERLKEIQKDADEQRNKAIELAAQRDKEEKEKAEKAAAAAEVRG